MAKHALKRVPKPKRNPRRGNPSMVFGRNPNKVIKFPKPRKNPRRK